MKLRWHIIFWVGVITILSLVFNSYFNSLIETFYFVSMLLPVILGTCYFFNLYLVPSFLLNKHYIKFIIYSIYMLVVSLYLEMLVIFISFILLAKYSYDNMSPVSSDVFVLTITLYFVVLLFSFILFTIRSFRKEKAIIELNRENEKNKEISITVRSNRQMKTVIFEDVLYIESLGDYVKIHLQNNEKIITKEKISSLEKRLPNSFIRIHRSFIVNKYRASTLTKESLMVGEQLLPISRTYKQQAWSKLTDE